MLRRLARTMFGAALVSLVVAFGVARPVHAAECHEVISGDNAQKLFDALRAADTDDGCVLDGVSTDASQMTILWTKGKKVQQAVLVVPTSCVTVPTTRGLVLSTIVPPSTAKACPESAEKLAALVSGQTFGGLVAVAKPVEIPDVVGRPLDPPVVRPPPLTRRLRPAGIALLVVAAAGAVFLALRRYLARRRAAGAPPLLAVLLAALRRALGRCRAAGVALASRSSARAGAAAAMFRRARSSAWARVRGAFRVRQGAASRAGWGAVILLGPHLVLGTWLVVVPDHLAFTAAQIVTLVHVGLAVLTFPLAALWILRHVLGMRGARPQRVASSSTRWLLTAATVIAALTGAAVIWGGDIIQPAKLHAVCGIAVGVPLACHLWLGSRRWAAASVAALLVVAAGGGAAARRWLPPESAAAAVPAFTYETRPASLYEPAANCGECHVRDYEDWRRSTHARTLELGSVQASMKLSEFLLGENVAHVGELLSQKDRPVSMAKVFGACGACHAPTAFYGDGKPSLLHPTGITSEGVGCSFCHTLREVRHAPSGPLLRTMNPETYAKDGFDEKDGIFNMLKVVPFYVSAPETVRRYIGQGSKNPIAHAVSNWLIRWRPQIHKWDYHSPVLDDSRACFGCHSIGLDRPDVPHLTYYGWEHSPFNTPDPKTRVECQDCHMVKQMTGQPVNDLARMVAWGPVRPKARSHLLLGGNVKGSEELRDPELARLERSFTKGILSISFSSVEREDDGMNVKVSVRSELVGHYFPAIETDTRYGWVDITALDAAGNVVAKTQRPRDWEDFGASSPLIMSAMGTETKASNQESIPARTSRDYEAHLVLAAGAAIDKIVAELYVSVDPTSPLATATRSVADTAL